MNNLFFFKDPAISNTPGYEPYETGLNDKVFIKKFNSEEPITGVVWPGTTVFPDFTNPNTTLWWTYLANKFHEKIHFDGLWIVIYIITKKCSSL